MFNKTVRWLTLCVAIACGTLCTADENEVVIPIVAAPAGGARSDNKIERYEYDRVLMPVPDAIMKMVHAKLGTKSLAPTLVTHLTKRRLVSLGGSAQYTGNIIVDERYTYHNLFSTRDENNGYALGVYVFKNLETKVCCVVRVEIKLNIHKSDEFDGMTVGGTVHWSGPHVGEWERVYTLFGEDWVGDPTLPARGRDTK